MSTNETGGTSLCWDRDSTPLDDNREDGHTWTFALIARLGDPWRAGLEALDLEAGSPPDRIATPRRRLAPSRVALRLLE